METLDLQQLLVAVEQQRLQILGLDPDSPTVLADQAFEFDCSEWVLSTEARGSDRSHNSALGTRLRKDLQRLWDSPAFLPNGGALLFPSYEQYSNMMLFPLRSDAPENPLRRHQVENLIGDDKLIAKCVIAQRLGSQQQLSSVRAAGRAKGTKTKQSYRLFPMNLFAAAPLRLYPHFVSTVDVEEGPWRMRCADVRALDCLPPTRWRLCAPHSGEQLETAKSRKKHGELAAVLGSRAQTVPCDASVPLHYDLSPTALEDFDSKFSCGSSRSQDVFRSTVADLEDFASGCVSAADLLVSSAVASDNEQGACSASTGRGASVANQRPIGTSALGSSSRAAALQKEGHTDKKINVNRSKDSSRDQIRESASESTLHRADASKRDTIDEQWANYEVVRNAANEKNARYDLRDFNLPNVEQGDDKCCGMQSFLFRNFPVYAKQDHAYGLEGENCSSFVISASAQACRKKLKKSRTSEEARRPLDEKASQLGPENETSYTTETDSNVDDPFPTRHRIDMGLAGMLELQVPPFASRVNIPDFDEMQQMLGDHAFHEKEHPFAPGKGLPWLSPTVDQLAFKHRRANRINYLEQTLECELNRATNTVAEKFELVKEDADFLAPRTPWHVGHGGKAKSQSSRYDEPEGQRQQLEKALGMKVNCRNPRHRCPLQVRLELLDALTFFWSTSMLHNFFETGKRCYFSENRYPPVVHASRAPRSLCDFLVPEHIAAQQEETRQRRKQIYSRAMATAFVEDEFGQRPAATGPPEDAQNEGRLQAVGGSNDDAELSSGMERLPEIDFLTTGEEQYNAFVCTARHLILGGRRSREVEDERDSDFYESPFTADELLFPLSCRFFESHHLEANPRMTELKHDDFLAATDFAWTLVFPTSPGQLQHSELLDGDFRCKIVNQFPCGPCVRVLSRLCVQTDSVRLPPTPMTLSLTTEDEVKEFLHQSSRDKLVAALGIFAGARVSVRWYLQELDLCTTHNAERDSIRLPEDWQSAFSGLEYRNKKAVTENRTRDPLGERLRPVEEYVLPLAPLSPITAQPGRSPKERMMRVANARAEEAYRPRRAILLHKPPPVSYGNPDEPLLSKKRWPSRQALRAYLETLGVQYQPTAAPDNEIWVAPLEAPPPRSKHLPADGEGVLAFRIRSENPDEAQQKNFDNKREDSYQSEEEWTESSESDAEDIRRQTLLRKQQDPTTSSEGHTFGSADYKAIFGERPDRGRRVYKQHGDYFAFFQMRAAIHLDFHECGGWKPSASAAACKEPTSTGGTALGSLLGASKTTESKGPATLKSRSGSDHKATSASQRGQDDTAKNVRGADKERAAENQTAEDTGDAAKRRKVVVTASEGVAAWSNSLEKRFLLQEDIFDRTRTCKK
ncbi:unnamed protein product [Amoebophrya sp. A120]|nr:unnamed protein product [Amoebophrya sp. A120]|eukprot:GSA120T00018623001.1